MKSTLAEGTATPPELKTRALNVWLVPATSGPASAGDKVIVSVGVGGDKVTMAPADFVGSAVLVAVTLTVCCELIVAGALYNPELEITPLAGLIDHVTEVLLVLRTVGVNCCVCPADSEAVAGDSVIETGGSRLTVAEADFVGSAWLVAVTLTLCAAATLTGAVYNPELEIAPTAGLIDQFTEVLLVLPTVGVNC